MSVTFNLFRVRKFPNRPADHAVVFRKEEELLFGGKPARTLVTFKEAKTDLGVEFYISKHEILKRVEGRLFDGTEFHEFFRKNEILLVLKRRASLLACKAATVVAKNLIDQINDAYPASFRADYLQVDFERIRPKITELNGIWISQINQPNMETLAIFGAEVDRSQLYKTLKSLGHAASILIRQQIGGSTVPVIVSSKGSITFPQPAAEQEQIGRALDLYENLLLPGVVEKDSRKSAQERREVDRADAKRRGNG